VDDLLARWRVSEDLTSRARLVNAAARLFVIEGYRGVGVNEICAAAGVQKGSFYHFFPSKADLATAAVDKLEADLCELLDEAEAAAAGPIEKLRASAAVVDGIQRRLEQSVGRVVGCPIGNLATELSAVDGPAAARTAAVLRRWEARVAEHFRAAAAARLLRPGSDPAELARALIATMQGMVLLAKVSVVTLDDIPASMNRVVDSCVKKGRAA
jgi:TetR/AcrR family transcriptional regulator, transcriptional repressor for nem operon